MRKRKCKQIAKEGSNFKNKSLKELKEDVKFMTKIGWYKIEDHLENKKERLENRIAGKFFNKILRHSSRKQ